MRILGGTLGGRQIRLPVGFNGRPTTDFAKEGLFNMLSSRMELDGIRVLDLFGGSGAVSFEFASRGASRVYCVEMSRLHASSIKVEAMRLGLGDVVTMVRANVFDFLPLCHESFHVVFADPPYALAGLDTLPGRVLSTEGLLLPGGVFVLEHGKGHDFSAHPRFVRERRYGEVRFSLFV